METELARQRLSHLPRHLYGPVEPQRSRELTPYAVECSLQLLDREGAVVKMKLVVQC
jgi:hypothetical protein